MRIEINKTALQQLAAADCSDCLMPQVSGKGDGDVIVIKQQAQSKQTIVQQEQNVFGINSVMNAAGVALAFNPFGSALGGASMGLACVMNQALNGRAYNPVKAISGLFRGETDMWRVASLVGLGAGGVALKQLMPYNLQSIPDSLATWRSIVAGLCLGLGSAMTQKGEAISELTTGSQDSLLHMLSFMATAMVTAQLAHSGLELGIPPGKPDYQKPSRGELEDNSTVLTAGTAMLLAMFWFGKQSKGGDQKDLLGLISEVATGVVYGTGCGLAGLTRPQKMMAFLSPMEDFWNLSLPFVYLGAVGLAFAGFKLLKEQVKGPSMASSYDWPKKDKSERKRIIGSVVYGVGVGFCGLSVAPSIVALCANPTKQLLTLNASMLGGMLIEGQLLKDDGISISVKS